MVVIALVGFFLFRGVSGGPTVEGTESMPPAVRKAFEGSRKGGAAPSNAPANPGANPGSGQ